MALNRSFPTQHPSGLSITDTRRVTAGLIVRNADGTPRAGIFPSNANPIVSGRASMGYDVAPFLAATSRINTGVELISNDAVTIVPTTAAPSSNSRIDVIWVRAQFVQHADANNDVIFGVTQGGAALTPSKPAIPVGALELATAEILSTTTTTATAVITQTHTFTAAAGGVVWLRNALDTWAAPDGSVAYRLDTKRMMDRVGGVWISQGASCSVKTSTPQATGGAYVPTPLTWNLEDVDTDGFHSTVSNTSRLVAPAAGQFTVTAKIRGLSTVYATGVQLGKNGVVDPAARQIVPPIVGGGAGSFPTITKTFQMNAGDYIEVFSLGEAAGLSLSAADCFADIVRSA
ncbi:hypothetical protein [Microbacterium maritypicum]|uniref:Uncharacterized protein n=1 Tax=Microbacterium maritypicum MF109 TaxID=1333857 RepID=T5KYN4_MICMQ|nr:hypothetical protein [Microbacterium liquefaciens]EQM83430.1 hypothetical protein L687_12485 [Microbacterium maritypicum MF109]